MVDQKDPNYLGGPAMRVVEDMDAQGDQGLHKYPRSDYKLPKPQTTSRLYSPVCSLCRHLTWGGPQECEAFKHIPVEIWVGDNDHRKPFPGDHGIQFEHSGSDTRKERRYKTKIKRRRGKFTERARFKHLQGQHNQKRHGWRFGSLPKARSSMKKGMISDDWKGNTTPAAERAEYRKRAYDRNRKPTDEWAREVQKRPKPYSNDTNKVDPAFAAVFGRGKRGAYHAGAENDIKTMTNDEINKLTKTIYQRQKTDQQGSDHMLMAINEGQGFLNKPGIETRADMDARIANGDIEIWRGVSAKEHALSLMGSEQHPDNYSGIGIYGNGIYSSSSRQIFSSYGPFGMRMALNKNAKIIDKSALDKIYSDLSDHFYMDGPGSTKAISKMPYNTSAEKQARTDAIARNNFFTNYLHNDYGQLAAFLGYDAIKVPANIAGGSDYYVIFNRSALTIQEDIRYGAGYKGGTWSRSW